MRGVVEDLKGLSQELRYTMLGNGENMKDADDMKKKDGKLLDKTLEEEVPRPFEVF